MSILLMENFSMAEGVALTLSAGVTTEFKDPPYLAAIGARTARYQTSASYAYCYGIIDFRKVEMPRDGETVERNGVLIGGVNSASATNYRYCAGMYIPIPETKADRSKLWFGMRLIQKPPSGEETALSTRNVRLGVSLWNDNTTYTAIRGVRRVLDVDNSNKFSLDRQAEADAGTGTPIFPKNVPGKPFFLDLEYNREEGTVRVWIDNIFCGEVTKWWWNNNAATAKYLFLGVDDQATKRTEENGFYLTDLLIAEDDGEGWCDRFGPDMWVESVTPTADTVNQWDRPAEYEANYEVVAKSSSVALDTTDAGNQDYLHTTKSGTLDAYRGDVFLKDNIVGVSSQSVVMNAGSAVHAVAPAFVSGEDVVEDKEILVTPGTSLPYAMRSLTTVNPATGEPFTKEEIEGMSFGFKVKY